jgi:hypothetical protein
MNLTIIAQAISWLARIGRMIQDAIFKSRVREGREELERAKTPEEKRNAIRKLRDIVYNRDSNPKP